MTNYFQILTKLCHCSENDSINYRPYEAGRVVESIPFRKALQMFEKDVEEMKIFLSEFGLKEKAVEATCEIWKSHIVIF